MRSILKAFAFSLLIPAVSAQESLTIGIIDFYGLRTITEDEIRAVLPFKEGDVADPTTPFDPNIELEIAAALGVHRVKIEGSCCPEPNVGILYVGVEETPMPGLEYRDEPTGEAVLPAEIVETAGEIDSAMMTAIRAGDSGEDWSEGHALAVNPEIRELQEKFIVYAEQYQERLIEVLHGSAQQRALAATVLGYAADKRAIVPHLERAVLDPNEDVRNNATRALTLIAMYANQHSELGIGMRSDVFVDMLNSVFHGDRNKASAVLWPLTQSRDSELLGQIRDKALPSLIEMCRWKADEHAFVPCIILERVLGLPEQDELHPKETTIAMAMELLQ